MQGGGTTVVHSLSLCTTSGWPQHPSTPHGPQSVCCSRCKSCSPKTKVVNQDMDKRQGRFSRCADPLHSLVLESCSWFHMRHVA
jgi:hypothetical protein